MLEGSRCKMGVLLLFVLFSMACFGQAFQSVQWDVPYYGYGQLMYLNWGQSGCGPTSIMGLLKFWFPHSTISIPEVYHGAVHLNTYNGPLYWYRNVGMATDPSKVWPGTTVDTAYDRDLVAIPGGQDGFQKDYGGYENGTDTEMGWGNAVSYLRTTWGGNSEFYNDSLDSLFLALQNGPVVAGVVEDSGPNGTLYGTGHFVLVTGHTLNAQGQEIVVFNEPYFPYVSTTATPPPNYPVGLKDRAVSKDEFYRWYYTNRKTRRGKDPVYITYAPPASYGPPTNASTASAIRLNTVVVDNGSYFLDETLADGSTPVTPSTAFQVDDDQAQAASGGYAWQLYHQNGQDFAYPTEGGHWVRWTPGLPGSGVYTVKVRSYKLSGSSTAYYSVKSADGSEIGGLSIDQSASSMTAFEQTVGTYTLAPGSYVEVADMPANTAADTVVFEYAGPSTAVRGTCTAGWQGGNQSGIVTTMQSPPTYSVASGLPTLTFTGTITGDGGNAGMMDFQIQAFSSPATGCQGLYGGFNLPAAKGPQTRTVVVTYDAQNSLLSASLDGGTPASISMASFMCPLSSVSVSNGYLGSYYGSSSPDFLISAPSSAVLVPTVTSFTPSGDAPIAATPFDGSLVGTGFNTSTLEVSLCLPATSSCYPQPAAGVQVTGLTSAQLTGVSLSAGTWVAKVRNGPSGAWSNTSPSFVVAAPPAGILSPGTCNTVSDHVGDVSFVNVVLDSASTPTVPVLDFTFVSGSAHAMADTHVYFFTAGCQLVDYPLSPGIPFTASQNVVQVAYDTVAGTALTSSNGVAPAPQFVGTGLTSVMVHPSDGIANAANSSDFLIPQPPQ